MFSHFFIERPIFAAVMSMVITLAGGVAVLTLPVAQYPPITPPSIMVQCNYPGANCHDVADSVAAPIEQQINGVEDMLYMVSQSNNDGSYTLTVTFKPGVNLNFAQVLVQNRINLALPNLPDVVKQAGVTTRKRNPDILQVIAFYSPNGRYNQLYLSNFATIKIRDELSRVDGVGDCQQFGQQDYSMRVWIDPERLSALNMTAYDVANALREQNRQVAAGQFGQQPTGLQSEVGGQKADVRRQKAEVRGPAHEQRPPTSDLRPPISDLRSPTVSVFRRGEDNQPFALTIKTLGRLSEPAEFEEIIIKSEADGRKVRIKDVGHVELGARSLDSTSKVDALPNASLAVWALPDANSIATARRVRERLEQLKKSFPEDLDYKISLDMTPFIQESIDEVIRTLIEAVVLVAAVVLVFLQNWRSALIPLVAVPVAVVGTFAVMAAIGFSLNCLTLFGLVLAIGIVVDDAIVVVEAVEHHIEEGLTPHQAAHKAMDQVSGPVVAVALVLSAVFIPCAFISGITGQFFRQFALTIACSTIISAFNSLTLSPALAAILLKPRKKGQFEALPRLAFMLAGAYLGYWLGKSPALALPTVSFLSPEIVRWVPAVALAALGFGVGWLLGRPLNWVLGECFQWFNIGFQKATGAYTRVVGVALRGSSLVLVVYGGLVTLTWWTSAQLPPGYIPNQDQGRFYIAVQLPDAASLERTQNVVNRIEGLVRPMDGVFHTTAIAGQSFTLNANGSNFGQFFVTLNPFEDRRDPSLTSTAITDHVGAVLSDEIPEAKVSLYTPPPVSGLGSASGFKIIIEDRGDLGFAEIQNQIDRIIARSKGEPVEGLPDCPPSTKVEKLFSIFRANTPQLYMDLNRDQCQTMDVNPADVFSTLQVYLGSFYVNDFNRFGRTWQVVVQASGPFRDDPSKIKLLKVRNARGEMVPLGAVLSVKEIGGPINIGRYNMYPAAAILGATKPGVSTGQGIEEMERLCAEVLPPGMAFEWTEINYMQIDAGKNIWNRLIFPLAVAFVFLVLAAQYESWALPLAVILVVPMCILGSLTGVWVTEGDINIFTQIGFVVLVGLASKNAILIVEFAKHMHEEGGLSRRDATLAACRLRLRPILMTSFAFILGVVPLLLGTGAGAEMRRVLGIAVFSGMLGVTLFGIFLTPVFFYVIEAFVETHWLSSRPVRVVGQILFYLLGIATLGLPWLLGWASGGGVRNQESGVGQ
jgi:multidrug efflux pump